MGSPTTSAISCRHWRCPRQLEPWSLTCLREKLITIGAKVVSHGRYIMFQMAEVAGAVTDVPQHPAADRLTARTAGASMRGAVMAIGPTNSQEDCVLMSGYRGCWHHQAADPGLRPSSGRVVLKFLLSGKGERPTIALSLRAFGKSLRAYRC